MTEKTSMSELVGMYEKKQTEPSEPSALKKLIEESGGVNDRVGSGYKKRYFIKNKELIFDLIDNHGVPYRKIVKAINDDGVEFSLIYFKRLMAAENKKRSKQ